MEPQKQPYTTGLGNDLKSLQVAVGGMIQVIYPFDDPGINLVCNDEGKLLSLPLNRGLRHPETGELYDVISGNFFLCGDDGEGEFCSLTEEQIKKYSALYHTPETFLMMEGKLCCFSMEKEI